MFLVVDPATRLYVFTQKDPRTDGFDGPVQHDVHLDEVGTLRSRSKNSTTAVPCLGRSRSDEKHYRVFECMKDCRAAGFQPVGSVYGKYQSWKQYRENA